MRPRTLVGVLAGLTACVVLPAAALQKAAAINGRPECNPSLYADPPVTLSGIVDTTALATALAPSRRDLEAVWLILEYAVTGQLQTIDLAAENRSKTERGSIAAPLATLFRPIPPQMGTLRLAVVFDSGSPGAATLRPVDLTCPPALTNFREIDQEFQKRLKRLRDAGTLIQASASRVLLLFTVTPEGRVRSPRVGQSSGLPLADSVALEVIQRARFRPAVAGRVAVAVPSGQPLQF